MQSRKVKSKQIIKTQTKCYSRKSDFNFNIVQTVYACAHQTNNIKLMQIEQHDVESEYLLYLSAIA